MSKTISEIDFSKLTPSEEREIRERAMSLQATDYDRKLYTALQASKVRAIHLPGDDSEESWDSWDTNVTNVPNVTNVSQSARMKTKAYQRALKRATRYAKDHRLELVCEESNKCDGCDDFDNLILYIPNVDHWYRVNIFCKECASVIDFDDDPALLTPIDLRALPKNANRTSDSTQRVRRHRWLSANKEVLKPLRCQECGVSELDKQITCHSRSDSNPLIVNTLCRSCLYKAHQTNIYPEATNLREFLISNGSTDDKRKHNLRDTLTFMDDYDIAYPTRCCDIGCHKPVTPNDSVIRYPDFFDSRRIVVLCEDCDQVYADNAAMEDFCDVIDLRIKAQHYVDV